MNEDFWKSTFRRDTFWFSSIIVIKIIPINIFIILVVFFSVAASILFSRQFLGFFLSSSNSLLIFIVFGSFINLIGSCLSSKFGLSLKLFLSKSFFFGLFLFLLFQDFRNRLIFFACWPFSSSGIDLLDWFGNQFFFIELDVWRKSSKEMLIQEFLDKTSKFSWSWIDLILESQSQFKEEFFKLMVHKLNSVDINDVSVQNFSFPCWMDCLQLLFISLFPSLFVKTIIFFRNIFWCLFFNLFTFRCFILSLFSSFSCLFNSFLSSCSFLVGLKQHWVSS